MTALAKAYMIGDANDAFWLAQAYFLTGHYLRAERLLTDPLSSPSIPQKSGIYTRPDGKGKTRDTGVDEDEGMNGSYEKEDTATSGRGEHGTREAIERRLIDDSMACRYLAAQCLVRVWFLSIEMKSPNTRTERIDTSREIS